MPSRSSAPKDVLERVAGIEPAPSAWKAEVLPLNNTRDDAQPPLIHDLMVEGVGFEPTKAEPSDLQSGPFGRSGTPPAQANLGEVFSPKRTSLSTARDTVTRR